MQQLLSKEFMYEPLKEVAERFPGWLSENTSSLSEAEVARYRRQLEALREIVACYDSDPDNFDRLVELMQAVQACGQPPRELVASIAPGLEFDENGEPIMPGMPAGAQNGCTVQ